MNVSNYRRTENRCTAKLLEFRRGTDKIDSWRCQLVNGHKDEHRSYSGHRRWEGSDGETVNWKDGHDQHPVQGKLL